MGKVNVYLPDDLERAVREAGIPVSAVCQGALRAAVEAFMAIRSGAVDRTSVPLTPRLEEVLSTRPTTALELLGEILLHGENLGARIVRDLRVELPAPRRRPAAGSASRRRAGAGAGASGEEVREVLAAAYRVALEHGHGYVGTEHVVLAAAKDGSPTADLFAALGLDDRAVQRRMLRLLANPWRTEGHAAPPPATSTPERLDRFERELDRLAAEVRALREGATKPDRVP